MGQNARKYSGGNIRVVTYIKPELYDRLSKRMTSKTSDSELLRDCIVESLAIEDAIAKMDEGKGQS